MFRLSLREFSWALSATVDLVGVTDVFHGRRVAFIASALARQLPGPLPWTEEDIILSAMVHDCGVSSTDVHEHLLGEMEWDQAQEHSRRGAELLGAAGPLRHLAGAILRHHRPWAEVPSPENPTPDEWLGNLLFLADRVDVLAATQPGDILFGYRSVLDRLAAQSPRLFNPAFVDALVAAAQAEAFWLLRQETALTRHWAPWIASDRPRDLTWEEADSLFDLYGQCVDGKSRFTACHSRAVGRLCYHLGRDLGYPEPRLQELKTAGLVHDIGKLRVPDRVLNFPDRLSRQDFSAIKHHSFDALDILTQVRGLEEIAEWASLHHERMDGSGYPYRKAGAQIPREARILAVADVFQALIQDRPYRAGMDRREAAQVLGREAVAGRLDPEVVAAVVSQIDRYFDLGQ